MRTGSGGVLVLFSIGFSLSVSFVSPGAAVAWAPAPAPTQAPAPAPTPAPARAPEPAPTPAAAKDAQALASDGRRLMNAGRLVEAREKLEQAVAVDAKADPEWVFDLGHCYERLHQDDKALDAYRRYRGLPLTLRAAEAERRIAAIEERNAPGAVAPDEPKSPPRYVLVPTKADKGKCVKSCDAARTCGRFVGKAGADQCEAARFSCLRNCPGARVSQGICPEIPPQDPAFCLPDRRGWVGPGLITPGRF